MTLHNVVRRIVDRGVAFTLHTSMLSHYVPAGVELAKCDEEMIHVKGFLWAIEPSDIILINEVD